jgi:hypothetical protein
VIPSHTPEKGEMVDVFVPGLDLGTSTWKKAQVILVHSPEMISVRVLDDALTNWQIHSILRDRGGSLPSGNVWRYPCRL